MESNKTVMVFGYFLLAYIILTWVGVMWSVLKNNFIVAILVLAANMAVIGVLFTSIYSEVI